MNPTAPPPLSALPPELYARIFCHLDIPSLVSLCQTARAPGLAALSQLRVLRVLRHPLLSTLCCAPDCDEETCDTEIRLRLAAEPVRLLLRLAAGLDEAALGRVGKVKTPMLVRQLDLDGVDSYQLVVGDRLDGENAIDAAEASDRLLATLHSVEDTDPDSDISLSLELQREDFRNYISGLNDLADKLRDEIISLLASFGLESEDLKDLEAEIRDPWPALDFNSLLEKHYEASTRLLVNRTNLLSSSTTLSSFPQFQNLERSHSGDLLTTLLSLITAFEASDAQSLVLPPRMAESRHIVNLVNEAARSLPDCRVLSWNGEWRLFVAKVRLDSLDADVEEVEG